MATTPKKIRPTKYDAFVVKLLLYTLLGSLWLKITRSGDIIIPIPVGLIIGILLTSHEHFIIDRKLEYAVLLIA